MVTAECCQNQVDLERAIAGFDLARRGEANRNRNRNRNRNGQCPASVLGLGFGFGSPQTSNAEMLFRLFMLKMLIVLAGVLFNFLCKVSAPSSDVAAISAVLSPEVASATHG